MAFIIGNVSDSLLPQSVIDALGEDVPCYGVRFDGENSEGIRTYDAEGLNWTRSSNTIMGTDDFANLAPFNVKECITQYNETTRQRELLAYKGDAGWDDLVANETGDRMIEVPCFWYARPSRYEFVVSPKAKVGFKPSPMHLRKGVLHDKIRITKYAVNDDYNSLSGYTPRVNTNMNTFRENLRNKGLEMLDYPTWCMMVQLMIIKYANMDVQSVVGAGRSSGNATIASGGTDSVLGLDGSATTVSANESVLTLGIENFYSNIEKFIDGIYGYKGKLYIKDVEDISSDPSLKQLFENYTPISSLVPITVSGGDIKTIAYNTGFDWMQFPIELGVPNVSGDFLFCGEGFNCVLVGGSAWDGSIAGLFCFDVTDGGIGVSSLACGALGMEIVPNDNITTINIANVSTYNNRYIDATNGLKLKTSYNIPMSTPETITDGTNTMYVSKSNNIDLGDYKKVEGVEVE